MIIKFLHLIIAASALPTVFCYLPRSSPRTLFHNPFSRPWNPSPFIDDEGFLKGIFRRKEGDWEEDDEYMLTVYDTIHPCRIRQVPGDGNCLFYSLSLSLQYSMNGTHWDMPNRLDELYEQSRSLRTKAVARLRQNDRPLYLHALNTIWAIDLVTAAAQQYNLTPEEYCAAMEEDCVWGGGPEIVALSNVLERPIHVYELAVEHLSAADISGETSSDDDTLKRPTFILKRMACFGSPYFDRKPALHILSADSRFPDIKPGQQLSTGNHFLSVFPTGGKIRDGKKNRLLKIIIGVACFLLVFARKA